MIRAAGGMPLTSLDQVRSAWEALRGRDAVTIDITRRGQDSALRFVRAPASIP